MTSTAQSIGSLTAAPSDVELESQFGDRGRRRRPRFFESIRTLAGTKSNTRPGYDASMEEVTQPISDAEILDLAYFMARTQ